MQKKILCVGPSALALKVHEDFSKHFRHTLTRVTYTHYLENPTKEYDLVLIYGGKTPEHFEHAKKCANLTKNNLVFLNTRQGLHSQLEKELKHALIIPEKTGIKAEFLHNL